MFPLSPLGNVMPAREWIREYPRRVTSAEPPESREAGSSPEPVVRQMGATYGFGRFAVAPLARMIYRPHVEGRAHVPRTGPVILASNHLSFIDSIAIPVAAPRPVHFLAKSSYFEGTGMSGWFSRQFFTAIGAVPVQRGAGQAALDALDQQRQLLVQGNAVALYPEGTRSLDGRLYKGRTGVAFLALQTGAPVVPVALIGTDKVMPVGARFPSLTQRVTVRFGEPLDLAHHGPAESGRARRLATDDIMAAIHALSGQALAGAYNETPAHNPIERIRQVLPHERR
jgi:1-acyl-sn-glycerol-3-phosphate acyltransferase